VSGFPSSRDRVVRIEINPGPLLTPPSHSQEGHEERIRAHQRRIEDHDRKVKVPEGKERLVCCVCSHSAVLVPVQAARLGWKSVRYRHDDSSTRNLDVDWYCPKHARRK